MHLPLGQQKLLKMTDKIVLVSIPVDDLHNLIAEAVATGLKFHKPQPTQQTDNTVGDAEFLTKKQAAKLLACSTSTIDNYARAQKLSRNYIGKTVRFKRAEVLELTTGTSWSADAARERLDRKHSLIIKK